MKYILIILFLILPAALLCGSLAGTYWYVRDHAITERTHFRVSEARYSSGLLACEIVGAIVGSLPGLLILLATRAADAKERQRAASILRQIEEDETIWPPPPAEGGKPWD